MSDLISRQAAIDACLNGKCANVYDCADGIEALPSAERRGEWVEDVAYYDEDGCPCIVTRCNQCGEAYPVSNFCPNCGADMRGEEDD